MVNWGKASVFARWATARHGRRYLFKRFAQRHRRT